MNRMTTVDAQKVILLIGAHLFLFVLSMGVEGALQGFLDMLSMLPLGAILGRAVWS